MKLFEKINKFLADALYQIWYLNKRNSLYYWLLPLSKIYGLAIKYKKKGSAYKSRLPIVVVGNITVGGSGKTPAIITLIQLLQQQGWQVGIISRGYPINPKQAFLIDEQATAQEVGDEPLLIYTKTHVPICVCANRVKAIQLLEKQAVDIILSDDGLQNQHFFHDIEIVLYDQRLQFGNQKLLPAGPLREPMTKLTQVPFVVEKTFKKNLHTAYQLMLQAQQFITVQDWAKGKKNYQAADFFANKKIVAITAIAHPSSFFEQLASLGIIFEKIVYPDHYLFTAKDFALFAGAEVIMTEKDAIKCKDFAAANLWCMPLQGEFSAAFVKDFLLALNKARH